jgi:hypothetical protein
MATLSAQGNLSEAGPTPHAYNAMARIPPISALTGAHPAGCYDGTRLDLASSARFALNADAQAEEVRLGTAPAMRGAARPADNDDPDGATIGGRKDGDL